jgi:hypothetical protein
MSESEGVLEPYHLLTAGPKRRQSKAKATQLVIDVICSRAQVLYPWHCMTTLSSQRKDTSA